MGRLTAIIDLKGRVRHHRRWCGAMEAGLRRHGIRTLRHSEVGKRTRADFVVCWSWRRGRKLRRRGDQVLVLERGYVGDRMQTWTSAGWNGLNGRATFPTRLDQGERWRERFADLEHPWRRQAGDALLLGQLPRDAAVRGLEVEKWLQETRRSLENWGHQVRIRRHPKQQKPERTLADDFAGAALAVSYSSNSSVFSVLHGIPTITLDEGAMAWPVTSHTLDAPLVTPDRTAWMHQLAWCQWTEQEMRDGLAWEALATCGVV